MTGGGVGRRALRVVARLGLRIRLRGLPRRGLLGRALVGGLAWWRLAGAAIAGPSLGTAIVAIAAALGAAALLALRARLHPPARPGTGLAVRAAVMGVARPAQRAEHRPQDVAIVRRVLALAHRAAHRP